MGLGGISIWQLLIVLAIVVVVFGTKRLTNLGSDLGSALKGFKSAMKDDDEDARKREQDPQIVGQARESTDADKESDRREDKAKNR